MITGYHVPGSSRGQTITLPDFCYSRVNEADADRIADELRRKTGREPRWQSVRGKMIQLAKTKGGAA